MRLMGRHNAGTTDELLTILTKELHNLVFMNRTQPGEVGFVHGPLCSQLFWLKLIKSHNVGVVPCCFHVLMGSLAEQTKELTTV